MRGVATILGLSMCMWASACGPSDGLSPGDVLEEVVAEQAPVASAANAEEAATEESVATADAEAASKLPVPGLDYNSREGRATFLYYCAPCHGTEGHGDGFNAYNLDPKPRDLADPTFQAQRATEDLVAVVRSGGGVAGLSPGMPPWGRTLNERQIRNVVRFLRTIAEEPDSSD